MERIRHKSGLAGIGGGAQCVLGVAVGIPGLLMMFLPSRSASVGHYLLYGLGALLAALGLHLVLRGMNTRRLVRQLASIEKLFANGSRVPIETAASYLRCSISALVSDVREIQKRGFVSGLYADLIRRDLVSAADGVDTSTGGAALDISIELEEQSRMPASPFYALGLTWVLWALGLPMYRISHFIACALVSAAAFIFTNSRAPRQLVIVERKRTPPAPAKTGNEALDEVLQSAQVHMDDLRRLDRELTEGKVADVLREILRTTEQIIDHVKAHPDSVGQIRQFLNYTLPTTVSLLQNYLELSRQRVPGENIIAALNRIESNMGTILSAYHRQLDALFRDKALNIEVELEVMKGMLGGENQGNDFGPGGAE